MYEITSATEKIAAMSARIRAVQGGTSAGKTISILQVLIDLAQRDKRPTVSSIVSESFPHLSRGAMRDFLSILQEQDYFDENRWNRTNSIYRFETGSIIEFFSSDQPGKARGPRRDRLFINEADRVPFPTFDQLEVRTKECIFLDWNPTTEFWFYDYGDPKNPNIGVKDRPDCEKIIITYVDNEALDPRIVESIESRKERTSWWRVYGLGLLGEVEGRIYTGWKTRKDIPHEARLERYGVDFGYTNDPTVIVAVYSYNGGFILDEIAYQVGMSNRAIADIILNLPKALVVADSAEPKSIDDIKERGVMIVGAVKGQDSVRHGIEVMQDQKITMTQRSTNLIKAYRNYLWEIDKDGKVINEPEHQWSDPMDAARYGITSIIKPKKTGVTIVRPTVRKKLSRRPGTSELVG